MHPRLFLTKEVFFCLNYDGLIYSVLCAGGRRQVAVFADTVTKVYHPYMVKAFLYDQFGYLIGEPEVPARRTPRIVVWGDEIFVRSKKDKNNRPVFVRVRHYVIPDTRDHKTT